MKILIADDHQMIREGLKPTLAGLDASLKVVEAWDAASLWDAAKRHLDLDLALVDLNMPGMNGAETIGELRGRFPALPVIVVSGVESRLEVESVLRAGASGYIPKSATAQVIVCAIRLVQAGGIYLPPLLLGEAPVPANLADLPVTGPDEPESSDIPALTARQNEILALLAQGLSNKMIARALDANELTVRGHLRRIFDVLGVRNRTSAVIKAQTLKRKPPEP